MAKEELRDFFNHLKKEESSDPVPAFEDLLPVKKGITLIWRGVAAAVAVILAAAIWLNWPKAVESRTELVFEFESEYPTQALLEEGETLMSWDTETDYLLEY